MYIVYYCITRLAISDYIVLTGFHSFYFWKIGQNTLLLLWPEIKKISLSSVYLMRIVLKKKYRLLNLGEIIGQRSTDEGSSPVAAKLRIAMMLRLPWRPRNRSICIPAWNFSMKNWVRRNTSANTRYWQTMSSAITRTAILVSHIGDGQFILVGCWRFTWDRLLLWREKQKKDRYKYMLNSLYIYRKLKTLFYSIWVKT